MKSAFIGKTVIFILNDADAMFDVNDDTNYIRVFGNDIRTGVVKGFSQEIGFDGEPRINYKIVEDGTGTEFIVPSTNVSVCVGKDSAKPKLEDFRIYINQVKQASELLNKAVKQLVAAAKSLGLVYEETEDVDEYPEWRQPTGTHDSYAKGSKITHNGEKYISYDDD